MRDTRVQQSMLRQAERAFERTLREAKGIDPVWAKAKLAEVEAAKQIARDAAAASLKPRPK